MCVCVSVWVGWCVGGGGERSCRPMVRSPIDVWSSLTSGTYCRGVRRKSERVSMPVSALNLSTTTARDAIHSGGAQTRTAQRRPVRLAERSRTRDRRRRCWATKAAQRLSRSSVGGRKACARKEQHMAAECQRYGTALQCRPTVEQRRPQVRFRSTADGTGLSAIDSFEKAIDFATQ